MRLIFAGTPEFSLNALKALLNTKHKIIAVYCQPDRPKGRGRTLTACPIKTFAKEKNLNLYQPSNFKDKTIQAGLLSLNADVMVVVAYGQILPIEILQAPKYGCLNIHASLLPRWRGSAPIQRAILAGDSITGIGIMQMDKGLDTGDILLQKTCNITNTDTAATLHEKLSILAAEVIVETLDNIKQLPHTAQDKGNVSYAKKLTKDEAWIDWHQSAVEIHRQIRAFNPYPIAQTHASSKQFNHKTLRILEASIIDQTPHTNVGAIISSEKSKCLVATGSGTLSLEKVQLAGKKVVNIKDFTNAYQLTQLF